MGLVNSHTNHGIMDILSCHVCKGIHHQSQVSPETILIPPEERTQTRFGKKKFLIRIKIFIFEIAKVKMH